MVEYAVLLAGIAGASLRTYADQMGIWASAINWRALTYALLGLVALRIAFWAFRPSSR